MKAILVLLIASLFFASCAHKRTFTAPNGLDQVDAHPYGWANEDAQRMPGVKYELSAGNIVWSIIFSETIIVPVYLTGWKLYQPVSYDFSKQKPAFNQQ